MTTLIAVYNSDGCVGRCDAKCYMATCQDCDCACGGINHGVGLEKAIDNTREISAQMIEEYSSRHKLPSDARWEIPAKQPMQLSLL